MSINEDAVEIALAKYRQHDDFRQAIIDYEAAKFLNSTSYMDLVNPPPEQPDECLEAFKKWRADGKYQFHPTGLVWQAWQEAWNAHPKRELSILSEDEFVGMWANKTWALSTFKFLEREGLKIVKPTTSIEDRKDK